MRLHVIEQDTEKRSNGKRQVSVSAIPYGLRRSDNTIFRYREPQWLTLKGTIKSTVAGRLSDLRIILHGDRLPGNPSDES